MKLPHQLLTLILAFIYGASSYANNSDALEYIDLSRKDQRKLVKQYWTIEKRIAPKYPRSALKKGFQAVLNLL